MNPAPIPPATTDDGELAELAARRAVRGCIVRAGRPDGGGDTPPDHPGGSPPLVDQRFAASPLVALDGDVATAQTPYLAVRSVEEPDALMLTFGTHLDRFERRDGAWSLAGRTDEVAWRARTPTTIVDVYRQGMGSGEPMESTVVGDPPEGSTSAELVQRQAVLQELMRTTRGIDRLDAALLDESFGEGTLMRVGTKDFTGPGFAAAARGDAGNRIATQHCVSGARVDVDGEHARLEADLLGAIGYAPGKGPAHLIGPEGGVVLSGMRYADDWHRAGGVWGLRHRALAGEWSIAFDGAAMEELLHDPARDGRRDRDDPSYARAAWARPAWSPAAALACDAVERCVLQHGRRTGVLVLNCLVDLGVDRSVCEAYVVEALDAGGRVVLEGRRELIDLERRSGRWRVGDVRPVREWRVSVDAATAP